MIEAGLGTGEAIAPVREPATGARIVEEEAVAIVSATVAYRPEVAAAPEGMLSEVGAA